MGMTCEEVRPLLAAYVLGALEPAEADDVRRHLAECGPCAQEGARSGATASLLELVPLEGYGPTPGATAAMDRLLGRVAAERRAARRRGTTLAVAAAAAVAVLAGVVGGVVGASIGGAGREAVGGVAVGGADRTTAASPSASSTGRPTTVLTGRDAGTGVSATVAVQERGWGTGLHLKLVGVRGGSQCLLVAVGRDGSRQTAATWSVPTEGYERAGGLSLDGAVGMSPSVIDRYVVETLDGVPLVTVDA